jgi:hypothetical protein
MIDERRLSQLMAVMVVKRLKWHIVLLSEKL